ncbi:MAG: hypothetical protein ACK5H1_04810 [Tenacibaculum sp.]
MYNYILTDKTTSFKKVLISAFLLKPMRTITISWSGKTNKKTVARLV